MTRLRIVPDEQDASVDRAARFAVRGDSGSLDARDQAEFDAWLTGADNAQAYAEVRDALGVFDELEGLSSPDLEALRSEAHAHRERRRPRWLPLAGGAVAAGIAGVIGFTLYQSPSATAPAPATQTATVDKTAADKNVIPTVAARAASGSYATAIGEQRVLVLADGSRVTMNTGTQIMVDYRPERRIVRLVRGQALFDVAHDPRRPFAVTAGERVVTALGTVFEVSLGRGEIHVTLMKGRVVIDPPRQAMAPGSGTAPTAAQAPVYLAPGQQMVATIRTAPEVRAVDVSRQLLWRQKLVEFYDEPVERAVAELNRYSIKPIVLSGSRVGKMRISGVYHTDDPAAFADLVTTMLPVASRETSRGEIELYSDEDGAR